MSMEKYEEKNYKVYRFCDGEIVDGLNRKHYNPQKEDDMQCICTILNAQIHELNKLQKENKKLQGKYDKQLWIYNGLGCEYDCLKKENEELKIRNKGKQAFIDKQDKIIRLLYNQCKDFKEILDDSNITYPIDERLNKFFEKGVKL